MSPHVDVDFEFLPQRSEPHTKSYSIVVCLSDDLFATPTQAGSKGCALCLTVSNILKS